MTNLLKDILFYTLTVIFWLVIPVACLLAFGMGLVFLIVICIAVIAMDCVAIIFGEHEEFL